MCRMGLLRVVVVLSLVCGVGRSVYAQQDNASVTELVAKIVQSAGGRDKLLTLFRMKDKIVVAPEPTGKASTRESFIKAPEFWYSGKRERVKDEKEPAIFLVWAWNLGAITDAKSVITRVPDIREGETDMFGLRVSGTINPPMEIYFTKKDNRLFRIDWRSDIHRFSEWKQVDGVWYASKTIGYKKSSGKPWYFSDILELERLKELPAQYRTGTAPAPAP